MAKTVSLLRESFGLLWQHMVLLYPVLLAVLLIDLVVPRHPRLPGFDAYWLGFAAFGVAIVAACSAGWFGMAKQLVHNHRHPGKEDAATPPPLQSLRLFKAFLPGVGDYFVPLLVGWLLFALLVAAIGYGVHTSVLGGGGYPDLFVKTVEVLAQTEPQNAAAAEKAQQQLLTLYDTANLTATDESQLSAFGSKLLVGLAAVSILAVLTMFWPALVVIGEKNAMLAYAHSIGLIFQNPVKLGVLGLSAYGLSMILLFLLGSLGPVFGLLGYFGWLMGMLGLGLFTCLYVYDMRHPQIGGQLNQLSSPTLSDGFKDSPDATRHWDA